MANTNEIIISIHKDDPEAFYAKIPYDKLPKIHRVGGKWMQSGKEWRFPLDDEIWNKFQLQFKEEMNAGLIKKDLSFILAFEKRHKDLKKFIEYKEVAMKDEPTDFGVEGVSLNGKNCLFNYQRWGVQCGLSVGDGFLIGDSMGLGKGQPYDELVYTPNGITEIGKLKVGDYVIGKNGKKTKVIGVYPQGLRNVYKFTFTDNSNVECDENHLWQVYSSHNNSNILNTLQLIDKNGFIIKKASNHNSNKEYKVSTYYKNSRGNNSWEIPICEPIIFDRNDELPIEPYLLGALIGNGSFVYRSCFITEFKDDFDEMFGDYIKNNYFNAHELNQKRNNTRVVAFNVMNELQSLGLKGKHSWEKFIPDCYKYSSIENRLALLQGLMDTDGYCIKASKNRINGTEYSTTSEQLALDVIELVQTLGGIARLRTKIGKYKKDGVIHECRKSYCINIKMPNQFNPFRLKRKAELYHYPQKYKVARFIKDISYIGKKETICIKVDACDELYLTRNCIVTHNTIQGIGIAKARMNKGEIRNCLIICPASLKYNWKDEIIKFTGVQPLVIGHKCKNKEDREKQWIAQGYQFKIVNYEMVARDLYAEPKKTDNRISSYKAVLNMFDMCIWDEIHMLKHHTSQRTQACRLLKAKYRVGLTGTPLDGRLEEIHSIFQILKPGLFVNKQKFMERYAEYDYFGAVKGYHHIKEVSDKIAPYYLRRLKEEVLKDLPPKLHKDMMVELSSKNMKAYKDLVKKKNDITENASAVELIMRARQFLDFPQILGMHNDSDKYKMFKELLDELVKQNNHKVIIFSQYTNTIHWLVKNLEDEYKDILIIDGSVDPQERQQICKKFNNEDKYKIIIGSNAMSTGLNMQGADDVINYTMDFSPAIMKQREDRAYRCGVKHTVTVYDFVCMDTVDEHVRSILAKKQVVNDALLNENSDSFDIGTLTAMEILSCL